MQAAWPEGRTEMREVREKTEDEDFFDFFNHLPVESF